MTQPDSVILGPTDVRRAAALLMHADPEATLLAGINAILAEAHADGRIAELCLALCSVTYGMHPELSDADGKTGLRTVIDRHIALENGEPHHD